MTTKPIDPFLTQIKPDPMDRIVKAIEGLAKEQKRTADILYDIASFLFDVTDGEADGSLRVTNVTEE
jgi:hypothetical protein